MKTKNFPEKKNQRRKQAMDRLIGALMKNPNMDQAEILRLRELIVSSRRSDRSKKDRSSRGPRT